MMRSSAALVFFAFFATSAAIADEIVMIDGTAIRCKFAADSLTPLSCEVPGEVDENLHDEAGRWVGMTVHVAGLELTARFDNGRISAPGLPSITQVFDGWQRLTGVVSESGTPLATLGFDARDNAESISLSDGAATYAVRYEGGSKYLQVLRGPGDCPISDDIASGGDLRRHYGDWLDPVASLLRLSPESMRELKLSSTPSMSLVTYKTGSGETLFYLVRTGLIDVAFDSNGVALFYSILFDAAQYPAQDLNRSPELQTVFPDHIIIARDGTIGAYNSQPAADGVIGFWSRPTFDGITTFVRFGSAGGTCTITARTEMK